MNDILTKLKHLPYWLLKAKGSGLKKDKPDDRDYQTGIFGWGSYTPKHQRLRIPTLSLKNQYPFNTCQWNALTVQKEIDEGVVLSVKSVVGYGKKNGMVSGDGFSTLRNGQKVLADWGIVEESILPDMKSSWESYSNIDVNYYTSLAKKHKTKTYWSVTSANDIYKLLDEGKILHTGIEWYTGFNQGGGFSSPWIIERHIGLSVGGHAFVIVGYDKNYKGKKVFIVQNSYGKGWGDDGDFYIEEGYFLREQYGCWVNLDMDNDLADMLIKYDGKNVKAENSPAIYFIQKGTKKVYPDWVTYLSFNGLEKGFDIVPQEVINKIPSGDNMDLTKSLYWDFIKHLKSPDNLNRMLEILRENK